MWNNFVQEFANQIGPNSALISKFHEVYQAEVEKIVQAEACVLKGYED